MNSTDAADIRLSVVIPAYNEAANLQPVVDETLAALGADPSIGAFELVIVDDGSSDATGAVADRLAKEQPSVHVIHHARNRGFGAALRSGFSATRGRYVSLITADGEVGPDQVIALLRDMGDADLIVGMRKRTVTVFRRVLTFGLNIIMRLVLGFMPDETGIYVVRGELLRRMHLQSDTGLANLEVLLWCRRWQCRIRSGVTHIRPRLSGESKVTNLRTMWRTFVEMRALGRRIRAQSS